MKMLHAKRIKYSVGVSRKSVPRKLDKNFRGSLFLDISSMD